MARPAPGVRRFGSAAETVGSNHTAADLVDAAALEPFDLTQADARRFAPRTACVQAAIGPGVAVHFRDAGAATQFAQRYRHLPCAEPRLHFFAALDERSRPIFWKRNGPAFRWNGRALGEQAISFLTDAVVTTVCFGAEAGTVTFHAAALAARDGAFALAGASGSGKSTTALVCALAGYGLYSDEFCRAGETGVTSFRRALSLRPGGVTLLARSAHANKSLREKLRARTAHGWPNANYDDVLGPVFPPHPRALRQVFWITGIGAEPSIVPITRYAVLPRVAPFARVAASGAAKAARLLDTFAGARCFELILGSPDETVRAIAEVVGPCTLR